MNKKHIHSLTGVRGLAALLVFVYHISTRYPVEGSFPDWLQYIAKNGWLGVDVFFILSGFVISYVHQKDFSGSLTFASWKRFMILRLARIYPVHFVTTIIPIVVLSGYFFNYQSEADAFTLPKLIYSLTLTNGFDIPNSVGWNPVSWSVSSEMFAYLLFPFLTFFIFSRKLSIAQCVLGCVILILTTVALAWHLSDGERTVFNWFEKLLRVTSEFMLGCFLFNIYKQNEKDGLWWLADTSFVVIVLLIVFQMPVQFNIVFIIAFGVLILGLSEDKGIVASQLSNRFWVYLGEISYSVLSLPYYRFHVA